MMPTPSATQWGYPAAPKRAFLIHGNTSSSHTWEIVAQRLAEAGFLVTAPNLLGHGSRVGVDFRLETFAEDLYSTYFANKFTYDVIIAHSFGTAVTLTLLPLLSSPLDRQKKTAVILVDPVFQCSNEMLDQLEARFTPEVQHVPSVEAFMMDNPKWTRQDAVSRVVGLHMVQTGLPKPIIEQNKPYECGHLFDVIPSHIEMTVLIADPEQSGALLQPAPAGPQIRKMITVKGCSHWIQHEDPDVIVKTAVDEVERLRTTPQS